MDEFEFEDVSDLVGVALSYGDCQIQLSCELCDRVVLDGQFTTEDAIEALVEHMRVKHGRSFPMRIQYAQRPNADGLQHFWMATGAAAQLH